MRENKTLKLIVLKIMNNTKNNYSINCSMRNDKLTNFMDGSTTSCAGACACTKNFNMMVCAILITHIT